MSNHRTPRPKHRAAGLIGAGLLVVMTGCNLLPFVSNDERIQISYVRSFKKGLSPTDNKPFGILLREVGKLAGYNLPTRYGIDLAPYLTPFPSFEPLSPTISLAPPDVDQATRELRSIKDQGGQLYIGFATELGPTGGQQYYTYKMQIARTPTGTTGQVAIRTTGSQWQGPTGSTTTGWLGQGRTPQVPISLAFQAQLALPQSAGAASLKVDLGFEQGGGATPLPGSAAIDFAMPNLLSANLSGRYGSLQAALLTGMITVKGDKTPETYQASITASGGNVELELINDERKLRIDLLYQDGVLSGTAKATDGRQAELAKIVQEAGKAPEIQYADGTKETWNFTLPAG